MTHAGRGEARPNAVDAYPEMWTVDLYECPECGEDHRSRVIRVAGSEYNRGDSCKVQVECPEGDFEADLHVEWVDD